MHHDWVQSGLRSGDLLRGTHVVDITWVVRTELGKGGVGEHIDEDAFQERVFRLDPDDVEG